MPSRVPADEATSVDQGYAFACRHPRASQRLKGQRQQRVAGQNRHRLAKFLMASGLPAPQIIIVESGKIVVNQRIGMDEFKRASHGQDRTHLAREYAKGLDAQNRANPLAARKHAVAHRLMNERRPFILRGQEPLEFGVHQPAVLFKKRGKFHPFEGRSGLLFVVRFERLGRHFAARLFQQDLHARFGLLQLLLAIAGKLHAFLEELHGLIQRQICAFHPADDLFQARQGLLKRLLSRPFRLNLGLRRLGLFPWTGIHALVPARMGGILMHAAQPAQCPGD